MKDILIEIAKQIDLAGFIIAICASFITYIIKKVVEHYQLYIKSNTNKIHNEHLRQLAEQVCNYIESIGYSWTSEEKLAHAVEIIRKHLEEKGIEIPEYIINIAVESAVKGIQDAGTERHVFVEDEVIRNEDDNSILETKQTVKSSKGIVYKKSNA